VITKVITSFSIPSALIIHLRSLKIDPKITVALLRPDSGTEVSEVLALVAVLDLPKLKDAQRLVHVNCQLLRQRVTAFRCPPWSYHQN
jgi:hypothetical protein